MLISAYQARSVGRESAQGCAHKGITSVIKRGRKRKIRHDKLARTYASTVAVAAVIAFWRQ